MQLHRYYNKNIMYIKILIIYQMFYLCIFKQLQNDLFIYLFIIIIIIIITTILLLPLIIIIIVKLIVTLAYLFLIFHVNLTDIK